MAVASLAGCGGGIRGHAEIGAVGESMSLGRIATAAGDRTLHIAIDVSTGALRIDLTGPGTTVAWTSTGNPSSPVRADVPLPPDGGPWVASLVALEAPMTADYRIDTGP